MKHNYNIRVDEPDPSEEVINSHRNFDRLLADHRNLTEPLYRRPLYRNPRAFIGLVMILLISFLVWQAVEEEDEARALAEMPIELKEARTRAFLNPPLPLLAPEMERFSIDFGRDTQLTLASGTTVDLPADAFAAPGPGSEESLEVQVSIRELSDPFDALLAGVPLDFGDADCVVPERMYQIEGQLDGKVLSLQPSADIRIKSESGRNLFEKDQVLYALDTATQSWQPMEEAIEVREERRPVERAVLNDGFGAVEYNEDGSVVETHVEHEEGGEEKSVWVRSFEASGTGWVMCGNTLKGNAEEEVRVQLVDGEEQAYPLMALYQVALEGKALRVFWPRSKDRHFEVQPAGSLFGFLPDGRMVYVEEPGRGGALEAAVSAAPVTAKDEIKKYLGLNAR